MKPPLMVTWGDTETDSPVRGITWEDDDMSTEPVSKPKRRKAKTASPRAGSKTTTKRKKPNKFPNRIGRALDAEKAAASAVDVNERACDECKRKEATAASAWEAAVSSGDEQAAQAAADALADAQGKLRFAEARRRVLAERATDAVIARREAAFLVLRGHFHDLRERVVIEQQKDHPAPSFIDDIRSLLDLQGEMDAIAGRNLEWSMSPTSYRNWLGAKHCASGSPLLTDLLRGARPPVGHKWEWHDVAMLARA